MLDIWIPGAYGPGFTNARNYVDYVNSVYSDNQHQSLTNYGTETPRTFNDGDAKHVKRQIIDCLNMYT